MKQHLPLKMLRQDELRGGVGLDIASCLLGLFFFGLFMFLTVLLKPEHRLTGILKRSVSRDIVLVIFVPDGLLEVGGNG